MEVNTRRVETPVPQEEWDPAEIHPGFEEMRGKRMAQEMRVETDGHVGGLPRLTADFIDAGRVDRLGRRAPRKEPLRRPVCLPVMA